MCACNIEVIKLIGKYLNTSVGPLCYNTDKVMTTVLDKQNVEGFASIVLRLAGKGGAQMSQEQNLLSYQWLEHIAMFSNQAGANPTFAKNFLQDINKALEKNTYLTGQFLTIADIALYYVLYPLLERLSISEREPLLHLCRWSKHIQAQPRVCTSKPPLPMNTLTLSVLAPAMTRFSDQIPRRIYPQEILKNLRNNPINLPKNFAQSYYVPPQIMERITAAPLSQYRVPLNPLLVKKYPEVTPVAKAASNLMPIDQAYTLSLPQLRLAPLPITSPPKAPTSPPKAPSNPPKAPKYPQMAKTQPKHQSTKKLSPPKLPALPEIPPLPKQTYPHELRNVSLNDPLVFHPQPFSFPGYPVVVYLKK